MVLLFTWMISLFLLPKSIQRMHCFIQSRGLADSIIFYDEQIVKKFRNIFPRVMLSFEKTFIAYDQKTKSLSQFEIICLSILSTSYLFLMAFSVTETFDFPFTLTAVTMFNILTLCLPQEAVRANKKA